MKKLFFLCCCIGVFIIGNFQKEKKEYAIRTVAFYNLENLFDTINNPNKNDESSPIMQLKTNKSKVYWDKIDKLGSVISQIGVDKARMAPVIIGVCEIENRAVLEDLVRSKFLNKVNYGIIHYESPDKRGIDVALLYQKRYFKPIHHESFTPTIYRDNFRVYTRDQLLVSGYLDDELIHLVINHWPSRRGGEAKSR
ncbi:MAG: endonuclease/exonuclease/phosphatase family protein, partial [Flavobacteriaceae bacterium]|nr:endonuclease/exonuclease/phosphatase family protein [Flavobacteriaceae bacterium]